MMYYRPSDLTLAHLKDHSTGSCSSCSFSRLLNAAVCLHDVAQHVRWCSLKLKDTVIEVARCFASGKQIGTQNFFDMD